MTEWRAPFFFHGPRDTSGAPVKLDKVLRSFESARMIAFLAVIGTLVLQMLLLFKSGGDSYFLWYLVLFQMILLYQSDIYIKVLMNAPGFPETVLVESRHL